MSAADWMLGDVGTKKKAAVKIHNSGKRTVLHGWPLLDRFMAYVSPEPMSGCWLWTGGLSRDNGNGRYGSFRIGPRSALAHRVSWELHRGPIPTGALVCHHCDNPPCVNPAHLFVGTSLDNISDMVAKGRNCRERRRGADSSAARFDRSQIAEIRTRLASGGWGTQTALAREFGVSQQCISGIAHARTYVPPTGLTGERLVVLVTAKCANNANGKPIADDTVKRVLEALFRLGEYARP